MAAPTSTTPDLDVDVLIVGAGLSGIGAAYRIQERDPQRSYAILEARDAVGGTWDLFRYPGIRSDSDMYTLSYPFLPWTHEKAIADGADIRQYIVEATEKFGIADKIRFHHKVTAASWDSATGRWTLQVQGPDGPVTARARFLYLCSGYYSYDEGYTPDFPGIDSFEGQVVHPQFWPEDLAYAGKKVVVIGSGATAVTLIPSMADQTEHITMLQRSPTYITALPGKDTMPAKLRNFLPAETAHRINRLKHATLAIGFYEFCRRFPAAAKKVLLTRAMKGMPEGYEKHLTPRYNPWDQRLCVVPSGDLFKAIKRGKASIVTDTIDTFDATGIRTSSGEHLDADIVVTATGLQLVTFGQIAIDVDGEALVPGETYSYKGLMFSGVPNFGWCIGYTNASWTLRADLSSQYVAKFLEHLDRHGYAYGTPDPAGPGGDEAPILDLSSGYVQRVADQLPKQGRSRPWTVRQNWFLDARDAKNADLDEKMVWTKESELTGADTPEPAKTA